MYCRIDILATEQLPRISSQSTTIMSQASITPADDNTKSYELSDSTAATSSARRFFVDTPREIDLKIAGHLPDTDRYHLATADRRCQVLVGSFPRLQLRRYDIPYRDSKSPGSTVLVAPSAPRDSKRSELIGRLDDKHTFTIKTSPFPPGDTLETLGDHILSIWSIESFRRRLQYGDTVCIRFEGTESNSQMQAKDSNVVAMGKAISLLRLHGVTVDVGFSANDSSQLERGLENFAALDREFQYKIGNLLSMMGSTEKQRRCGPTWDLIRELQGEWRRATTIASCRQTLIEWSYGRLPQQPAVKFPRLEWTSATCTASDDLSPVVAPTTSTAIGQSLIGTFVPHWEAHLAEAGRISTPGSGAQLDRPPADSDA